MTGGRTRILLKRVRVSWSDESSLRWTRRVRSRPCVGHDIETSPSFSARRLLRVASRLPPPLGPNLDARRRRYRPEAVFVHGAGVRGNPLALAKSNPDAYAYPTPFALSPAFTPDAERLRDVLGSDGPVYFLPGG